MKFLRQLLACKWAILAPLLCAGVLITGCGTVYPTDDISQFASSTNLAAVILQVGDPVTVTLSGTPKPEDPHEERITEDGTITLTLIGTVKAAGKTPGELQKEIYNLYVPKYYNSNSAFNVTVQSTGRAYYVLGEVKESGPKAYIGTTTVTKAIAAAGGLTDFAKKSKIQLTRADGTSIMVNYNKALKNPADDPQVYPGDRIVVGRSII